MKRLVVFLLCVLLLVGCCACSKEPAEKDSPETTQDEPETVIEIPEESDEKGALDNFSSGMWTYMQQSTFPTENYMVSPVSMRAALCLAMAGATDETKAELLKATRFASEQDAMAWMKAVYGISDELSSIEDVKFSVANSVWSNDSLLPEGFSKEYAGKIVEKYFADVYAKAAGDLKDAINAWCDEKTNHLIPQIADDEIASASIALLNAIYVKSNWLDPFVPSDVQEPFYNRNGSESQIAYLKHTDAYGYYEDELSQAVEIPLNGGLSFIMVMGGNTEVLPKLAAQESFVQVRVSMPAMDISTTLTNENGSAFFHGMGIERSFSPRLAQFDKMSDAASGFYISSIIQKTKLKTDENGLEAAAATMVGMKASGAFMEQPKEFVANKPFVFYVIYHFGESDQQVLFFGQYVSAVDSGE